MNEVESLLEKAIEVLKTQGVIHDTMAAEDYVNQALTLLRAKPETGEFTKRVRDYCNKATPAPWIKSHEIGSNGCHLEDSKGRRLVYPLDSSRIQFLSCDDGKFIAFAREDLPKATVLLDAKDEEIEKLKEIIAGLREALQKSARQLLDYVDRGHL